MANENNTQATEGTTNTQTAPAGQSGERTFTQAEVNELVGKARMKERNKYEGYVKADEAAEAKTRAEAAEAELAQLKADAARAEAVAAVADKANVPTDVIRMLNGKDADELEAQVTKLLKLLPAYPTRTDDGGGKATTKKDSATEFGESIDKFFSN